MLVPVFYCTTIHQYSYIDNTTVLSDTTMVNVWRTFHCGNRREQFCTAAHTRQWRPNWLAAISLHYEKMAFRIYPACHVCHDCFPHPVLPLLLLDQFSPRNQGLIVPTVLPQIRLGRNFLSPVSPGWPLHEPLGVLPLCPY